MKVKDFFRYIARPLKIFITLSILAFIILFFQFIFIATAKTFGYKNISSSKPEGRQWDIHRSQKCFLPDGTVNLIGPKNDQYGNKGRKTEKIYDVNYTLLWEGPEKKRPDAYDYLKWTEGRNPEVYQRYLRDKQKITPDLSSTVEIPVRRNNKIKEVWRYEQAEDIFAGYEFKGDKIGYIGANGFTQSKVDVQPFGQLNALYAVIPLGYETPVVIWQTDRRVFTLDFENRKIEILIDGGDKKISDVKFNSWSFEDNNSPQESKIKYRPLVQYKTNDGKWHLILFKPDQQMTLKIPEEWQRYFRNNIETAATQDGVFLYHSANDCLKPENFDKSKRIQDAFYKTSPFGKSINNSAELYRVDGQGNISLVNKFTWIKPEVKDNKSEDIEEQLLTYATTVSPPLFSLFSELIKSLPPDRLWEYSDTMTGYYLTMFEYIHPQKLSVNIVFSILMMGIVLWHGWARRINWLRLICWIVFAGLFNIAGLLTYLAFNHTVLIKCHVCGKSRGLERPECNRCGIAYQKPRSPILSD